MPSLFIDFEEQLWVHCDKPFHLGGNLIEPGYHPLPQFGRVKVARVKYCLTLLTHDGNLINLDGSSKIITEISNIPDDVCDFVASSDYILLLTESGRMMIYEYWYGETYCLPKHLRDIENVSYIGLIENFSGEFQDSRAGYLINNKIYQLDSDDDFAIKISKVDNVAKFGNGKGMSVMLLTDGSLIHTETLQPLNPNIIDIVDLSVRRNTALLLNVDGQASIVNIAKWKGDFIEQKIKDVPEIIQVAEDCWLLDVNHNVWKITYTKDDSSAREITCARVAELPQIRTLAGYPLAPEHSHRIKSSRKI